MSRLPGTLRIHIHSVMYAIPKSRVRCLLRFTTKLFEDCHSCGTMEHRAVGCKQRPRYHKKLILSISCLEICPRSALAYYHQSDEKITVFL